MHQGINGRAGQITSIACITSAPGRPGLGPNRKNWITRPANLGAGPGARRRRPHERPGLKTFKINRKGISPPPGYRKFRAAHDKAGCLLSVRRVPPVPTNRIPGQSLIATVPVKSNSPDHNEDQQREPGPIAVQRHHMGANLLGHSMQFFQSIAGVCLFRHEYCGT